MPAGLTKLAVGEEHLTEIAGARVVGTELVESVGHGSYYAVVARIGGGQRDIVR